MRASKLHECGAVISLVEEMRQMGEICDVSKVATVLFAGRLKVARRILQPLVDSGLIVMDSSGCLSSARTRKSGRRLSPCLSSALSPRAWLQARTHAGRRFALRQVPRLWVPGCRESAKGLFAGSIPSDFFFESRA